MSQNVLVLLAEGFEEIEAMASVDILRRADINVILCGLKSKTVKGAHDIKVLADTTLDNLNADIDAVLLPGGMPGAANLAASKRVAEIIRTTHGKGGVVAAICAAPALVLAPSGILEGKSATCYPGMEKGFGTKTAFRQEKVVVDGNIITSQGPGTALEFALAVVEKLAGKEIAGSLKVATLAG